MSLNLKQASEVSLYTPLNALFSEYGNVVNRVKSVVESIDSNAVDYFFKAAAVNNYRGSCNVANSRKLSESVYESTEPLRHQCEVNYASSHDGEWIKEYLEKVKEKRGFDSYKKLRNDILKVWGNK